MEKALVDLIKKDRKGIEAFQSRSSAKYRGFRLRPRDAASLSQEGEVAPGEACKRI